MKPTEFTKLMPNGTVRVARISTMENRFVVWTGWRDVNGQECGRMNGVKEYKTANRAMKFVQEFIG